VQSPSQTGRVESDSTPKIPCMCPPAPTPRTAALRDNIAEVVRLYEGGLDGGEIAERYGVNRVTVIHYLRLHGVEIRKRGHGLDGPTKRLLGKAQCDELVRRYRLGATSRELAEHFDVSKSTILNTLRRLGEPRREPARPRSERLFKEDGYVLRYMDPDDPMASMRTYRDYVLEHRLVMARHLGRPLLRTETVHHINGERADNRIENLELHQGRHGAGQCLECADCGSRNLTPVGFTSPRP
jgi:DNA-binding CsgD family transcriptional regulator/uncharacterized protein (DUF1330 family)